jgi:hypothetical protein
MLRHVDNFNQFSSIILWRIITCRHITRQREVKHVPAEANAWNNSTSVARERSGKHTFE